MTPPPRKKLIEVSLPLDAINRESAREKSIRHGHPSTLHLWWARRPLAACRAVLFSSLVDDPSSDPHIGADLPPEDREHLISARREDLHALIRELVKWENSNNESVINAARAEIARSVASRLLELGQIDKDLKLPGGDTVWDLIVRGKHDPSAKAIGLRRPLSPESVNAFLAEHAPPVLDPFCGGGSIPLEAQRLGLRAYGSDLNPVPVLITKALIEIPPKFANMPPVHPDALAAGPQAATKGKRKSSKGQTAMGTGSWKGAQGLAADVRAYGQWMRDEAEKRIGHLYPKIKVTKAMARDRKDLRDYVGQELTVIAWLWARTVPSPNPAAGGTHVPLVRSFWLATKKGKEAWVEPVVGPDGKSYRFEVCTGTPGKSFDPKLGTVQRSGGTCLLTNQPIPFDYIREEGKAGRMADRLMAVVAEGSRGRVYLSPTEVHEQIVRYAEPKDHPDTPLPEKALSFRVMLYGMDRHYKLFTPRQLVALMTFSDLVMEAREGVLADARGAAARRAEIPTPPAAAAEAAGVRGSTGTSKNSTTTVDDLPDPEIAEPEAPDAAERYADAVATYLGLAASKSADGLSVLCSWMSGLKYEVVRTTFSRQALPMVWDFAESNPFAQSSGDYYEQVKRAANALDIGIPRSVSAGGLVRQIDATNASSGAGPMMVSTDPPYYDNIGYADLSDFFYVWLRRTLRPIYPALFRTLLTPKAEELIATPHRHDESKDKAMAFFESGLGHAFKRMRETEHADYPLTVFYAFKQAESDGDEGEVGRERDSSTASTGWETMLEGLIKAGFAITGTWPVRTERSARSVSIGTNALASSIVLVCHPRGDAAPMASRREFVTSLKRELPDALRDLQSTNIAPVDLAQAAIGPGMAVFSRYAKVLEPSGERMGVRAALGLINQVLDEVLAEQEGEYDADTRWAVKWFEQHAFDEGAYGDADNLARAMAVGVNGLVDAGILLAKGGKVRLLRREELMGGKPDTWDPVADTRLCHWEATQHLIHRLETGGEQAAADLLRTLGAGIGEVARDLAYRLYTTCERKKWAQEAISYNALVVSWPEIQKLAARAPAEAEGTLYS